MLPLEGLKILDFSTLLPGPYATMLLADMGADVLRIESPSRPDLVREMSPKVKTQQGSQSTAFEYLNRGKRSMALDLKHSQSINIIHKLLAEYDVVIEQFRPGVMQRLGLDFETLSKLNPKLVYCSITGYGQSGLYRDRAGHDINYLALSGISQTTGRADSGPALSGMQMADVAAGSHPAVYSILAAVIQRQVTGQGQHIDISMCDQAMSLQPLFMPVELNSNETFGAEEHFLNGSGIYDYYRTADNRYMSVGSLEPQFRKSLLNALGQVEWFDLSDDELKPLLREVFMQKTQADWIDVFAELDACVEPVLTIGESVMYENAKSRQIQSISQNGVKQTRPAPILSGMSSEVADAPYLGQDNNQVMSDLGFSESEINELRKMGVFGTC